MKISIHLIRNRQVMDDSLDALRLSCKMYPIKVET